jgi:hypothetical protein
MNLMEILARQAGDSDDDDSASMPQADALVDNLRNLLPLVEPKTFAPGDAVLFVDRLDPRPLGLEHLPMVVVRMRDPALDGPVSGSKGHVSEVMACDVLVLSQVKTIQTFMVWEDSRRLLPWTMERSEAIRLRNKKLMDD